MNMQELAQQLRALKDGGLNYTLDDLIEAMDRTEKVIGVFSGGEYPPTVGRLLDNLQIVTRSRARKAA